jgi:hypothetical protein
LHRVWKPSTRNSRRRIRRSHHNIDFSSPTHNLFVIKYSQPWWKSCCSVIPGFGFPFGQKGG